MKLFKRFHIPHSKKVTVAAAVAVGLALCLLCMVPRAAMAAAIQRDLPIYCVQKDSKVCSLTFDAAWGNEDTQQLIDILGKYNIKATFFVVGEWVDKYPESVKALHDAGHEIMNHSDNHPYFTKLSAEQIKTQLNTCNEKIAAITGVTPILFRPPYGDYNDSVVATVRECGMYCIQWDVDSLDWKDPTPDQICQRVLKRVQPGSIVLFHNAAKNTPAALPSVIEGLIQQGYSMVPVSQLILRDNFTMDHTGRQIPGQN
ncbi:MAG: polysaccharide deacetylase family protein [Clostridiaceae bacterium]|nr:polysaccharide deacetylase family protein [Clostridia bacterium]MDY3869783.1 polysaccharide deacetylase family protein [Clostridiaceae bacterium]